MTKKEAVIKAVRHEHVHPVPYSLEMTLSLNDIMKKYTGDENFSEHSGSYLLQVKNKIITELGGTLFKDMYGVIWVRSQDGDIGVIHKYPVPNPDFGSYRFPEPDEGAIREKCRYLLQHDDKFTIYLIGFSLFERAWSLHTMENVLMNFILEPDFMEALLDKILQYNLGVIDIVGDMGIDCIMFGDDWGQQRGLIMGYPIWKKFLKPRLHKMYKAVKQKGMFTAQHSCGDCSETFPDLIEMGLDIYNTFQPEIYDIEDMKKTYGRDITFYGGISTQRLLPFHNAENVIKETRRILKVLSEGGGYILAPTHAMTPDIPPENVMAFLKVCQEQ